MSGMIRKLQSKIKSPLSLSKARNKLSKKSKVIFTNGCFDLIHSGHVQYLQRARQLGTHLIVALNTDSSVKLLKGSKRPIHKLEDRLLVIAALECVDFVTWFSDQTPLSLILKLNPDVITKGGDWKPHQIIGSKEVLAQGGAVKSLPFIKGKSTTSVIQKIKTNKK